MTHQDVAAVRSAAARAAVRNDGDTHYRNLATAFFAAAAILVSATMVLTHLLSA